MYKLIFNLFYFTSFNWTKKALD
ncbi:hypothetical protein LAA29_140050 [Leuconostoc carnosum]|nr:hypothetical protein LAA29_140050 [Leuconostoc carnosum]